MKSKEIKVYVLDINGNPLMLTSPRNAKKLLKENQAKVIARKPFTIQLLYYSKRYKQDITLGVDTGYENIGLSANSKKEELYTSEVKLRTNVSKLISTKSMYRKHKRNKLWYRKPRYLNRGKKGWIPPSVLQKLNSHLNIVEQIYKILPITKIIAECAKFDIQKIKDSFISGKKYQEGPQKGFDNVNAYVLERDRYTCRNCNKIKVKLQVHHIESRKTGTNNHKNLIALCKKCHDDYHKGKIKLKIKKSKGYKAATFMNIVRKRLLKGLKNRYNNVEETFGYITKSRRLQLGLEKSHVNDAFCIANGNSQKRTLVYNIIQKRKNNRSIQKNRKGFKPSIRRKRYKIQPYDIITFEGKRYISKGSSNYGKHIIILKDNKRKSIDIRKVKNVFNVKTFVYI